MRSFSQESQRLPRKALSHQLSTLKEILTLIMSAPRNPSLPNLLLGSPEATSHKGLRPGLLRLDHSIHQLKIIYQNDLIMPVQTFNGSPKTWLLHLPREDGALSHPLWKCWRLTQRHSLEQTKLHDFHVFCAFLLTLLNSLLITLC